MVFLFRCRSFRRQNIREAGRKKAPVVADEMRESHLRFRAQVVPRRIRHLRRDVKSIPQDAVLYFRQRALRVLAELDGARGILFVMERYEGGKRDALVRWAEANPRVRRVWVYGASPRDDARDTDLDVAIELAPVVDGDETLALWMANAGKWHEELEQSTGTRVDLEWFDADTDAPMDASARLAYERESPDPEMH